MHRVSRFPLEGAHDSCGAFANRCQIATIQHYDSQVRVCHDAVCVPPCLSANFTGGYHDYGVAL